MSQRKNSGQPSAEERATIFVGLLAKHQTAVMRYIFSLLANWADTEDVWQTTSVVLWKKFETFQPNSDFMSWACAVARFQVSHFRRKSGRDRLVFSDDLQLLLATESLEQEDRLAEERKALSECLQKLPSQGRDLLNHRYLTGTSLKHLAERQGQTPNSVYKHLQRIRAELLACIEHALSKES